LLRLPGPAKNQGAPIVLYLDHVCTCNKKLDGGRSSVAAGDRNTRTWRSVVHQYVSTNAATSKEGKRQQGQDNDDAQEKVQEQ
jgi:hypothetical protein